MVESTNDTNSDSIDSVVADWQKRLLQMDRRNNLLYFKPGRTAVLIADYTPDRIAERLESTTRGLKFDYVEPRTRSRPFAS